jgi:uncharacterized protein YrrD
MLFRASDVINLPVISRDSGEKIDNVEDVVYDPNTNQIVALLVDKGGWFDNAKIIKYEDVYSIGHDAVLVKSIKARQNAAKVSSTLSRIAKSDTHLSQTHIITEDGDDLGRVTDILFDFQTGQVQEFEVSQGGLKDLQSGKKRVKVEDIVTIGKDATIVKEFAENDIHLQAQNQGLQGAVHRTGEQVPDVVDQIKQSVQGFGQRASAKMQDLTQTVTDKAEAVRQDPGHRQKLYEAKGSLYEMGDTVKRKVKRAKQKYTQKQKQEAVGKYVTVNILNDNDEILARRGDMITNQLIYQAETNHLLDQVLANTSPNHYTQTPNHIHTRRIAHPVCDLDCTPGVKHNLRTSFIIARGYCNSLALAANQVSFLKVALLLPRHEYLVFPACAGRAQTQSVSFLSGIMKLVLGKSKKFLHTTPSHAGLETRPSNIVLNRDPIPPPSPDEPAATIPG